jgi:tetratricopeptide (TPR) repeat protein
MSDLITELCRLTAEILQEHPHADATRLVGLVKQGIVANSQLGQAIQGDRQLIQINEGNAKGFQTLVTGGIANIGIHLNDVNRETLQEVLQEALGDLLKSLQKQIPSNVRQGSKNFVGREEELADIHAKLQEGQGVIVCAVEGMGGVGKTELALQYATRYQQEYVARYWLSLREMGLAQAVLTLASPYLDLPEAMQSASLDEQAAWYWQNWLPESGKLLVILDDVPNAESIPDVAMPIDPRVRVLVTTRERELNVGFESVPLDVLSEEKALELLRKIVGAAKVDKELVTVKEICNTLGYLPLGIELIGEYLSKNRFLTFAKLQERLNLADESISRERKYRFYAHRGVEAAIQLSWDDISTGSQRVAMLLGLFAPVEIFWELVAWIGASAEITEDELNEARGQLDSLHLIQPVDEECNFYKIHTLVCEFFRAKLLKAEVNHQFRQAFVNSLLAIAKEIPSSPTIDLIARVAPAIPHLDLLSREMLGDILNPEEDLIWAFEGTARFYEGQGFYALAEDPYQRCFRATQELLGDRHPDVAQSLNNLAELYRSQGRYVEAEPLYQEVLKLRRELLGDRHPDVAQSLNNLAALYQSQGRYAEAEQLYQKALQLWRELLGDRHPSVATSLNNLAALYQSQGRYAEAEKLKLQCLEIERETLGERHPRFATSLNNLAELYRSQGRYAEAEPLYQEALKLTRELLGDRHPSVALSLNNLAELYRSQGRYAEAEPLYQESLQLRRELLGNHHPDVATSLNNLATLYDSQGRYAEVEPLYQESLQLRRELLGDRHPSVALSLNNLAALYQSQGRCAEAEPLYQESLQLWRELLGDIHPDVATSLNNLAGLYQSQGRYAEAEPLYQESLQLRRELLGNHHPDVALSLNNLAALYQSQGRCAEAESLCVKSLEILEVSLGMEHPNTKAVRNNLQFLRDPQNK